MDLTLRLAKGFVQTKLRELLGISPRLILECADTSALSKRRRVAAVQIYHPHFYRQTTARLLVVSHQDRRSLGNFVREMTQREILNGKAIK
jgi:hypothetical protein